MPLCFSFFVFGFFRGEGYGIPDVGPKKKGQKRPSKIFLLNLAEKNKRELKSFCNFSFF